MSAGVRLFHPRQCDRSNPKVDVDGTMTAVQTSGLETRKEGSPVIVFESGFGTPMGHWDTILKQASALAPTVAYDRPGIADSQPDQQIPTVRNVADRLRKLLAVLNVKPPYVLVGHSLGGVYVRGFAKYYPKDLVGVVIIDPADFTETYVHIAQFMLNAGLEKNYVDSTLAQRRITAFQPDPKMPLSLQRELNVLLASGDPSLQNSGMIAFPTYHYHSLLADVMTQCQMPNLSIKPCLTRK